MKDAKAKDPREKITKEDLLTASERVYLLVCGAYCAYFALRSTLLAVTVPLYADSILLFLLLVTAAARILLQYRSKLALLAVACSLPYFFIWDRQFQPLALLTVGAVGIPFRKVLKSFLIGTGTVIAAAILASLCGAIPNLVYFMRNSIRSSWGINYPTDYATIILFLLLTLWVLWKHLPDEAALCLAALSFLNAWIIAGSRTSMICSVLFGVLIVYRVLETRLIENKGKLPWIRTAVNVLLQAAMPLFALFSLVSVVLYAKGTRIGLAINSLLNNHIRFAAQIYEEQGLSLFGKQFGQVGFGGSVFTPSGYNFIDSSYPRILLLYGIVTILLVCVLWVLLTRRAIKAGERRLALALALIAVHSFSEHHFIELNYNAFLILPFAMLEESGPNPLTSPKADPRFSLLRSGSLVILSLLTVSFLPLMLSHLRALYAGFPLFQRPLVLALGALALLAVIAVFLLCLSRTIAAFVCHEPRNKRSIGLLCASALLLAAASAGTQLLLHKQAIQYDPILEEDRSAVETILEAKSGPLYANQLGEFYRRKYGGFRRSVFDGEDLARAKNATVIVDKNLDSNVFIQSGFHYAAISDRHGVYTQDKAVISALLEKGYTVSDYCYAVHTVDLGTDSEAGLRLGGPGNLQRFHSQYVSPSKNTISLHSGTYSSTWLLKIDPQPFDRDYEICRITIHAYNGSEILRDLTVWRSWFDEDGELSADVVFSTGNYPGIVFQLAVIGEQEVELRGLSYVRSPGYEGSDEKGLLIPMEADGSPAGPAADSADG